MSNRARTLSKEELRKKFGRPATLTVQSSPTSRHGSHALLGPRTFSAYGRKADDATHGAGLSAVQAARALAFIDGHLDENITLADLARIANLSIYYFATQFKRSTGFSPHRYILHRRVNRARELLRNTSLSVLEVSLDLGFQHQNNFTRAFRRITGTTPTRFRHDGPSSECRDRTKPGQLLL